MAGVAPNSRNGRRTYNAPLTAAKFRLSTTVDAERLRTPDDYFESYEILFALHGSWSGDLRNTAGPVLIEPTVLQVLIGYSLILVSLVS